jgi:peptide/nickel transport system substrate-binding protein
MKKYLIPLAILLTCIIVLSACSGTSTTTPPTSTTQPTTTVPTTTVPTSTTPTVKPTTTTPTATQPTTTVPTTTPPAGAQQYGGTLRYIAQAGPGAPIGAPWFSNGTSTLGMQFAEEFLIRGMADASFQPNLVASWDLNSDPANASVTLHLQKGIKFHDGSDFDAAAVKWNLDMSMNAVGSTNKGSMSNVKSVDVVDSSTVKVSLKTWQSNALSLYASSVGYMVSPTAYTKNGADWMNDHMVGTAAFMQKDYQRDVALNVTAFPGYWQKGKPYLNGLSYIFVSDALTAEALFKAGGGEVLQSFTDLMTSHFRAAGYKIISSQVAGATSMWPDSKNADSPWSNVKVRMAAEYALDKQALANTFGYGNWTPAYQNMSPVSPAYDPNLVPRKYDVAKAKQLLTEAGYPNGFKTTLIVSPFGTTQEMSVAIQAMWKAVGIVADLTFPQSGAYSAMLTGGTWHNGVLFGAGAGSANPLSGWNLTFSPTSVWFASMARPAGIGDLFNTALTAAKLDTALLQKVEDAIFNDATINTLWFAPNTWVVTDNVMDSSLGTRDMFAWFESQNTWLKR